MSVSIEFPWKCDCGYEAYTEEMKYKHLKHHQQGWKKGEKLVEYFLRDMWSCGTGLIEMTEEQVAKHENEHIRFSIGDMSDEQFDYIINKWEPDKKLERCDFGKELLEGKK